MGSGKNYVLFDTDAVDVVNIEHLRVSSATVLEPELAAGAVAHLTDSDFEALEHSIHICAPVAASAAQARAQRQEDLHFHDVLAAANPNALLRYMCELINQLLRLSVPQAISIHLSRPLCFSRPLC